MCILDLKTLFFIFFLCTFPKGSPSPESGKLCVVLNPETKAKWQNWECDQKLGYICKKRNFTLIPSGMLIHIDI